MRFAKSEGGDVKGREVTRGALWTILRTTALNNEWGKGPPVLHCETREVAQKIQPQQDGSAEVRQDHQFKVLKMRAVHSQGDPATTRNRRRAGLRCQQDAAVHRDDLEGVTEPSMGG